MQSGTGAKGNRTRRSSCFEVDIAQAHALAPSPIVSVPGPPSVVPRLTIPVFVSCLHVRERDPDHVRKSCARTEDAHEDEDVGRKTEDGRRGTGNGGRRTRG